MLESMFFIVLVTLVHVWTIGHMGTYALDAVGVVLVTAIGCDLWREWRARAGDATLTTIWEIHQTYAVAPAVRLLEANGVRAFIKGSCLRALLQFFGPYVPVRILVPSEQAARAHALLQTRWPIRGE